MFHGNNPLFLWQISIAIYVSHYQGVDHFSIKTYGHLGILHKPYPLVLWFEEFWRLQMESNSFRFMKNRRKSWKCVELSTVTWGYVQQDWWPSGKLTKSYWKWPFIVDFLSSPWKMNLPSGYVKIAIENGHRHSELFPLKNGGSFHSFLYVYQRVTCHRIRRTQIQTIPFKTPKSRFFYV